LIQDLARSGNTCFLQKPFRFEQLSKAVAEVLA
jgi:FixJ family two-component response regulator